MYSLDLLYLLSLLECNLQSSSDFILDSLTLLTKLPYKIFDTLEFNLSNNLSICGLKNFCFFCGTLWKFITVELFTFIYAFIYLLIYLFIYLFSSLHHSIFC